MDMEREHQRWFATPLVIAGSSLWFLMMVCCWIQMSTILALVPVAAHTFVAPDPQPGALVVLDHGRVVVELDPQPRRVRQRSPLPAPMPGPVLHSQSAAGQAMQHQARRRDLLSR